MDALGHVHINMGAVPVGLMDVGVRASVGVQMINLYMFSHLLRAAEVGKCTVVRMILEVCRGLNHVKILELDMGGDHEEIGCSIPAK